MGVPPDQDEPAHEGHEYGVPIVSFRRAWLTACKSAGVPERIPHDFRRTAVRNLERAGVPRSSAMAMVGHKTESVYRRYAIADEQTLREGAAKLQSLHTLQSASSCSSGVLPMTRRGSVRVPSESAVANEGAR